MNCFHRRIQSKYRDVLGERSVTESGKIISKCLFLLFMIHFHLLHPVVMFVFSCRLFLLVRIGVTVLATFALCWFPFLSEPSQALQVVRRIFPVARGLFEVQYILLYSSFNPKTTSEKLNIPRPTLKKKGQHLYLCHAGL